MKSALFCIYYRFLLTSLWRKFINRLAMAQRSESRAKFIWALPSKQAILKRSFIMAQRSADAVWKRRLRRRKLQFPRGVANCCSSASYLKAKLYIGNGHAANQKTRNYQYLRLSTGVLTGKYWFFLRCAEIPCGVPTERSDEGSLRDFFAMTNS